MRQQRVVIFSEDIMLSDSTHFIQELSTFSSVFAQWVCGETCITRGLPEEIVVQNMDAMPEGLMCGIFHNESNWSVTLVLEG